MPWICTNFSPGLPMADLIINQAIAKNYNLALHLINNQNNKTSMYAYIENLILKYRPELQGLIIVDLHFYFDKNAYVVRVIHPSFDRTYMKSVESQYLDKETTEPLKTGNLELVQAKSTIRNHLQNNQHIDLGWVSTIRNILGNNPNANHTAKEILDTIFGSIDR